MRTQLILLLLLLLPFIVFFSQLIQTQQINVNTPNNVSLKISHLVSSKILPDKRVLSAHAKATNNQQTLSQQATQLSSVSFYLLNAVNAYRSSLSLYPVKTSFQTCAFAKTRAQEIAKSFSHDLFYGRVNSHMMPYVSWSRATENIAETTDYKQVVTLWKNSPGHAANMRDNTPYVCIQQYGNYFAYEGMRL